MALKSRRRKVGSYQEEADAEREEDADIDAQDERHRRHGHHQGDVLPGTDPPDICSGDGGSSQVSECHPEWSAQPKPGGAYQMNFISSTSMMLIAATAMIEPVTA